MKRIVCLILGHPDSVIAWGPWRTDEELGRYRVLTESCTRCDGVMGNRTLTEWDVERGAA